MNEVGSLPPVWGVYRPWLERVPVVSTVAALARLAMFVYARCRVPFHSMVEKLGGQEENRWYNSGSRVSSITTVLKEQQGNTLYQRYVFWHYAGSVDRVWKIVAMLFPVVGNIAAWYMGGEGKGSFAARSSEFREAWVFDPNREKAEFAEDIQYLRRGDHPLLVPLLEKYPKIWRQCPRPFLVALLQSGDMRDKGLLEKMGILSRDNLDLLRDLGEMREEQIWEAPYGNGLLS